MVLSYYLVVVAIFCVDEHELFVTLKIMFFFFCAKPNQANPSQAEASQAKPSQAEASQAKPTDAAEKRNKLDLLWIYNRFTMCFSWICNGFTMNFRWICNGFPVQFQWNGNDLNAVSHALVY